MNSLEHDPQAVRRQLPVVAVTSGRSRAEFLAAPEEHARPQMTPAQARLRMLLVDELDGAPYVFDPETTDISFVSGLVADALRRLQAGEHLPPELADSLLAALQLSVDVPRPDGSGEDSPWALTIHLNHACNLACEYCYADGRTSDTDGSAKGAYGQARSYMRESTLAAGVRHFLRDAPGRHVTIGFLGGEPLLSESRFLESVQEINDLAHEAGKTINYEITTNGTLLSDRVLAAFLANDFRVCVSVDGGRERHDEQRPQANGRGSYDTVMRTLNRLAEAKVPFGVRMTAFRDKDGLADNHLALLETPALAANFKFSMYGREATTPMSPEEERNLFTHYLDLATRMLHGDTDAMRLNAVREVLSGIMMKSRREFQCGAGRWDFALTPVGDVYPCHRFVGMQNYKIGNVLSPEFRFAALGKFVANAVGNRPVRKNGYTNCGLCYAHHVCGGGCAQIAAANSGAIGELPLFYCQETRLRVRATVRGLATVLAPARTPDEPVGSPGVSLGAR